MPLGTARTQTAVQVRQAVTKAKKNTLPPFDSGRWVLDTAGTEVVGYKLTITAKTTWQSSFVDVPIKPNTKYMLTVNSTGSGAITFADLYSSPGAKISTPVSGVAAGTYSITTTADTSIIRIVHTNGGTASGTMVFTNSQLEEGQSATPFEPYQAVPDLKQRVQLLAVPR